MTYREALETIISEGKEQEAIYALLNYVFQQNTKLHQDTAEQRARLRAIKKLNKAHAKDEAIAALSEAEK